MTIKTKCVHCGFLVHEFTTDCPQCGKPVANKYAPTSVSASPRSWKANEKAKRGFVTPVIIALAAIAIIGAVFYYLSMHQK